MRHKIETTGPPAINMVVVIRCIIMVIATLALLLVAQVLATKSSKSGFPNDGTSRRRNMDSVGLEDRYRQCDSNRSLGGQFRGGEIFSSLVSIWRHYSNHPVDGKLLGLGIPLTDRIILAHNLVAELSSEDWLKHDRNEHPGKRAIWINPVAKQNIRIDNELGIAAYVMKNYLTFGPFSMIILEVPLEGFNQARSLANKLTNDMVNHEIDCQLYAYSSNPLGSNYEPTNVANKWWSVHEVDKLDEGCFGDYCRFKMTENDALCRAMISDLGAPIICNGKFAHMVVGVSMSSGSLPCTQEFTVTTMSQYYNQLMAYVEANT